MRDMLSKPRNEMTGEIEICDEKANGPSTAVRRQVAGFDKEVKFQYPAVFTTDYGTLRAIFMRTAFPRCVWLSSEIAKHKRQ
jgi:hypothetical protein